MHPKYYKSLSAAANKFVPLHTDVTPEQSEESEEEAPKTAVRPKRGQIKKPAKEMNEEIHEGNDSEEDEELITRKPTRKVKGNADGKSMAVEENPKIGFKKGKYNSEVKPLKVCLQLESKSEVPNFDCSTRNSNRELIRAAKIGSKKLLTSILTSKEKITNLIQPWGVNNKLTCLKILLDKGDKGLLLSYLDYFDPIKNK